MYKHRFDCFTRQIEIKGSRNMFWLLDLITKCTQDYEAGVVLSPGYEYGG